MFIKYLLFTIALASKGVLAQTPVLKPMAPQNGPPKLGAMMFTTMSGTSNPVAIVAHQDDVALFMLANKEEGTEDSYCVIDLRTIEEFNDPQGHIVGAFNLPVANTIEAAQTYADNIKASIIPSPLLSNARCLGAETIIFHCQQSSTRTPIIAAAFAKFINNSATPFAATKVALMYEGYSGFLKDKSNTKNGLTIRNDNKPVRIPATLNIAKCNSDEDECEVDHPTPISEEEIVEAEYFACKADFNIAGCPGAKPKTAQQKAGISAFYTNVLKPKRMDGSVDLTKDFGPVKTEKKPVKGEGSVNLGQDFGFGSGKKVVQRRGGSVLPIKH